jgi:hypothetical protein
MPTIEGIIEAVSVKKRTTKYGEKDATSFKLNGEWYSGGFKTWTIDSGDDVALTFQENAKGYKDVTGIAVKEKAPPKAGGNTGAPRTGRAFPMDALDPGRVIVRQNMLRHATKTVLDGEVGDISLTTVGNIIATARQFEAYACGDLDREEAEKLIAAQTGGIQT